MINLPYISKVGKGRQVDTADNGGREDRYQRTVHGKLFSQRNVAKSGVFSREFCHGNPGSKTPGRVPAQMSGYDGILELPMGGLCV